MANEEDILRDQNERSGLHRAIADVETALLASTPGTRRILESSLEGMKGRIATLDKKIGDAIHEREVQAREQAASIAAQAQKEVRLSESEKRTYSGFLAKEFFTKQDFKSLDQFYSKSWDRLSEDGKEEMSHRFWEGIRHNEYRFTDAPAIVQEKESRMVFRDLTGPSNAQTRTLEQIPEADRADFIRAYQNGDRNEVGRVLSRDSFRQNMAVESSTGMRHKTADLDDKVADDKAVVAESGDNKTPLAKNNALLASPGSMADLPTDALNLSGVKLVDASAPSVAAIPDASGPRVNVR